MRSRSPTGQWLLRTGGNLGYGTAVNRGVAEFGGAGLPRSLATAVFETVSAANMAFGLCPLLSQGAMEAIAAHGSDAQKDRWLPRLSSGLAIGCFGLTEPDFGSHASGMRTRAEKKGGKWILNGTKRWITNGTVAEVAVVWARTDDGIRGFLVERGMPGFEARDIKGKFSLRGSITSELFLSDVEVPEEDYRAIRRAILDLPTMLADIAVGTHAAPIAD